LGEIHDFVPSSIMVTHRISATELARKLGDVLGRVRYRGESFIVERNGTPVARLEPVARATGPGSRPAFWFWAALALTFCARAPSRSLLGLDTREALEAHPQVGASREGFLIANVLERLGARRGEDAYFWATHAGAALDLLVVRGPQRVGFEIERTVAPAVTRSMRIALEDVELERIEVLHAGRDTFPLAERIRAGSAYRLWADVEPW
jgi:prevent-host-death family protein